MYCTTLIPIAIAIATMVLVISVESNEEKDKDKESTGQKQLSSQDVLQLLPKDENVLPNVFGLLGNQMFSVFRNLLKSNPKLAYQMMKNLLKSQKWLSKEQTNLLLGITESLRSNEHLLNLTLFTMETIDIFFNSESGRRIVKLMPEIKDANSERLWELLRQEIKYNQDLFLSQLHVVNTNDFELISSKSIARISMSLYYLLQKSQNDLEFNLINNLLTAKNLPNIDQDHVFTSFIRILEKLINISSIYEGVEMRLTKDLDKLESDLFQHYFNSSQLSELNEVEMEILMSKFLEETLVQPMRNVWLAYKGLSDVRCIKYVVCLYNEQYLEENEIRRIMARLFSFLVFSKLQNEEQQENCSYKDIYEAIWIVYDKEDEKYEESKSNFCWRQFVSKMKLEQVCHDVFNENPIHLGQKIEHGEL